MTHPVLSALRERATPLDRRIVLSEGDDPRVIAAALDANASGLARVSLVGDPAAIEAAHQGGREALPEIHDPATSPLTPALTDLLVELRGHKGMTPDKAAVAVQDRLTFAALMVRAGHADGTVGGAVATTSDTVRAALQIIGKAPDAPLVSSFFLMVLPEGHASGRDAMIFSDSGLVIDPDSDQLAGIAAQSAASWTALTGHEARVAFLSFSTKGSARHARVGKVTTAAQTLADTRPDIASDGELQFDAAFVPEVGASKAPGSPTAGRANVMIFPDLDAGNIGYKIAQRVGGCEAIGPILQGLNRPANDLSRGCNAEDIVNLIAVTALQAAGQDG
ncbi:phosphate acetyltransferase [Pseudaestuariivita atlantica]|uniref:Phosphate acetyltransferase n=1 Tax=Pseudaestuariivita atlantica TaxID=1317121 RepID=A0A0L1JQ47_9RHOB|nr:phosphate acetyltransferase [Pseudaestuariivita atlantica]KNG93861.1 phosphate acetyltransferase [Pseudaestuariivita atlantica]